MLMRNCAGGIVFSGEKVFLLKNEKNEWMLPKAVLKQNEDPSEVAVKQIRDKAGLDVDIVSNSGKMSYDFHTEAQKCPICNKTMWYVMKSKNNEISENAANSKNGEFFTINEALDKMTCNHDKSLVNLYYTKFMKEIS